jgi:glycosyltransferase involved in cell wall biosynthesis
VAINARAALRAQIGGVERYTREMARRLPAVDPSRYTVLKPHQSLAHRAGHLWEQVVLPIQSRRFGLVYSPANAAPASSHNNLVVIHDAAVLRYPEAYSSGYVAFHSRLLRRIAGRAKAVITDSEFSRGELNELLRLPVERFRVVPCGVAEPFSGVLTDARPPRSYGLARPYVLSVATLSARKNLNVLETASQALSREGIDLVLAGAGRPYMSEGVPPMRRLGYVPDGDLPALYAGARAFVMPSRYEGFGLPCLEAMACGVPVVAARAGALPETVGDAGLLVDPHDPEQFADGLLALVHDEELRGRLIERGLRRAKLFSWSNTAAQTDEVVSAVI